MTFNMVLLVLAVIFGAAYFAKRNHRKQREMKAQAKRAKA